MKSSRLLALKRTKHPLIGILTGMLISLSPAAVPAGEEPLTLETAVQTALNRNERALIAEESLAAAAARLSRARSFFFPSLTLNGTYTRRPFEVKRDFNGQQIVIQSLNAIAANAALNMIILDSRGIPGLLQANYEKKAAMQNTLESKRKLAFEVAAAFLMTTTVDQVENAARQRCEFAQKTLDAARTRFSAGLVSINDVTRAELEYASAEKTLIEIEGDTQTSRLQLGYLLNMPVSGTLVFPEWLAEIPDQAPIEEFDPIHERRPDIQSLQFTLKSLKSAALEPMLRWLPTLSLTGQYRYTNEAGLTGRSTNWNLGLSLSWPILDGFARIADQKALNASVRIARFNLQAALRMSELELHEAEVTIENQKAALKQAILARDVAARNTDETAELYRQGLTGVLQVADANLSLYDAEVGLAQARTGLAIAFLNLRAARGFDPLGKEMKK